LNPRSLEINNTTNEKIFMGNIVIGGKELANGLQLQTRNVVD